MREVLDEYKASHKAPHVDTIHSEGGVVTRALASMVWGYNVLKAEFRDTASRLRGLEDEVDEPGGLASLTRQIQNDSDVDEDLLQDASSAFAHLKRKEMIVLVALAEAIDEASVGFLADIDNGKTDAILDFLVGELEKYPDAPGVSAIVDDLTVQKMVAADEADGELDADADTYKGLLDKGVSEEDVEKIASHEKADELVAMDIDMAVAIAQGDLDMPDEKTIDRVELALNRGETPDEANLDERYFPPDYVERIEAIAAEQRELEDSIRDDGKPPQPHHIRRREQLAREREAVYSDDPDMNELRTAEAVGNHFGDSERKGKRLGEIVDEGNASYPVRREIGEILVESDEDTNAAFFNEVGAEGVPYLPSTEQPRNEHEEMNRNYSIALGKATKSDNVELEFTGDQLVDQNPPPVILKYGEFDNEFITSATERSIQTAGAEEGDDGPIFDEDHRRFAVRDMLIDRSTEYEGVPSEVVRRLAETGDVDRLLYPDTYSEGAFPIGGHAPSADGESYPITTFLTLAAEEKEAAKALLVSGADPEKGFKDPGTAAGMDAVMAKHATVMYDEEYLAEHGIDPEGSGRLSQEEMAALGFGPEEWRRVSGKVNELGFGAFLAEGNDALIFEAMQNDLAVQTKIEANLDRFRNEDGSWNQAEIAAFAEELKQDGHIQSGDELVNVIEQVEEEGVGLSDEYGQFSYASGSLHQRAFQAQRRAAQQLDDDSEAKNQFLAAGLSAAAAIGIAVTAPTSAPTAVVVGVDIGASTAISYLSPEAWETGRVLEITQDELNERTDEGYVVRMQARLAYLEALGEEVTLESSGEKKVVMSVKNGIVLILDKETREQWVPDEGEFIDWSTAPTLERVGEQAGTRVNTGSRVGRREAEGEVGGGLEGVEKDGVQEWLNQW